MNITNDAVIIDPVYLHVRACLLNLGFLKVYILQLQVAVVWACETERK